MKEKKDGETKKDEAENVASEEETPKGGETKTPAKTTGAGFFEVEGKKLTDAQSKAENKHLLP